MIFRAAQAACVGLVMACACGRERPPRERLDPALTARALVSYADIASASYGDALAGARALSDAVSRLLADPSEQTLEAARETWRSARIPYLQTEVYRFYGGPIDHVELLVNTWPIDEGYVEAARDGRDKGVIDDVERYPTLERALLVSLNARDGETSISTGYHVIEFLLWGRDEHVDGPGARPASDFVAGDTLADRRRRYLELASALLVQHLEQVQAAWRADGADSYRARFLALAPAEALGLALRGMGALSGPELAGERLTVPYETRDQENEQSCFSDTTHVDIAFDALGVENVCLGRYVHEGRTLQGTGLCQALASVDPELARSLTSQVSASVAAARQIPAPFDRALGEADDSAGRRALKRTIDALSAQTQTIERALALLQVAPGTGKP